MSKFSCSWWRPITVTIGSVASMQMSCCIFTCWAWSWTFLWCHRTCVYSICLLLLWRIVQNVTNKLHANHCACEIFLTLRRSFWGCQELYHCKKKVGCFNLRMVTLVADKLERQWLREVYFGMEDWRFTQDAAAHFLLQPQYTNNPQNICEWVITNALQSCGKDLSCS